MAKIVCGSLLTLVLAVNAFSGEKVQVRQAPDRLIIKIGDQLFAEYHYTNVSRPYLYPLLGPGGVPMTRNWPMKEVSEKEERDHPHHKSWWYAHGSVNGIDFWAEGKESGQTVHEKFTGITVGPSQAVVKSHNKLVAKNGKVVCTDDRTMTFHGQENPRIFDFEITIHASHGDVVMGDTKEGTLAVRLAETMKLKKPGQGHIVNSEGVRDGETWGKRAPWVDYNGPVKDQMMGVAIFDHPSNPRYPTWWHVRDYGLFAANPFGIHDFEKKAAGTGDFKIPSGQSATFRYRFVLHQGDEKQAGIARLFEEWSKPK